jgi:hypothetical protein
VLDPFHIGVLTALFGMLLIGASSDRYRERRWHIIVPLLIGSAAMAASPFFIHSVIATVALFAIASAAIIGAVPVFFSLPATFLKGRAGALWFFASGLILSSLLVVALPARLVNR